MVRIEGVASMEVWKGRRGQRRLKLEVILRAIYVDGQSQYLCILFTYWRHMTPLVNIKEIRRDLLVCRDIGECETTRLGQLKCICLYGCPHARRAIKSSRRFRYSVPFHRPNHGKIQRRVITETLSTSLG